MKDIKFLRRTALPANLLVLMAGLLIAPSLLALQIEKVLALATADGVRVEIAPMTGEDFAGVEFRAAITQVGSGRLLWQGPLGQIAPGAAARASFTKTLSGLKPELWNPASPVLYNLQVTAAKDGQVLGAMSSCDVSGSFEIKGGQFHLNGRPVFLRGIAINPPGRTIPPGVGESRPFAEAYVRYLKSQNVNIFRLTTDASQVWFDVCDELGMMMYAGHYGSPPGADEGKRVAPTDFDRSIKAYRKLLESYVSHPCIVMYLLANELPVSGERGKRSEEHTS